MLLFISAISIGFLGSFHCIGMCGPIALALPINQNSITTKISGIFLYNFGRAFTYSVLGLLFGFVGSGFVFFGLQQVLSISIGLLILLSILLPKKYVFRFSITGKLSHLFYRLKSRLNILFSKNNLFSLFSIGILNGLLPCGLVYIALTGALALGNIFNGMFFMAAFGLGTIPVMFSLLWFRNSITVKFRLRINNAMPYFISFMAILMIFRGMNLGIPYLSPSFDAKTNSVTCCEKSGLENKLNLKTEVHCCHKNK